MWIFGRSATPNSFLNTVHTCVPYFHVDFPLHQLICMFYKSKKLKQHPFSICSLHGTDANWFESCQNTCWKAFRLLTQLKEDQFSARFLKLKGIYQFSIFFLWYTLKGLFALQVFSFEGFVIQLKFELEPNTPHTQRSASHAISV